jgi:hypothetical protein
MKYKAYHYEWYDHFTESGWKNSVPVDEPYLVHGIGWLIGEDNLYLHFTEGVVGISKQYKGTMSVLKSALKKKTLLMTIDI